MGHKKGSRKENKLETKCNKQKTTINIKLLILLYQSLFQWFSLNRLKIWIIKEVLKTQDSHIMDCLLQLYIIYHFNKTFLKIKHHQVSKCRKTYHGNHYQKKTWATMLLSIKTDQEKKIRTKESYQVVIKYWIVLICYFLFVRKCKRKRQIYIDLQSFDSLPSCPQ